jgi:methylmalonyl-CoA carboxyltransferase 1.3S subunit
MKLHIVIDGKTYEVEYETVNDTSSSLPSASRVQSLMLPTSHELDGETSHVDEEKVCRSPVAGIVTRICVEPGRPVGAGDILMIVEAMKMENNLAATSAAIVASIKVKMGETVKAGQAVIEFE